MAKYSRLDVWNAVVTDGFIPIFYQRDVEITKQIIAACAAVGIRLI